MRISKNGTTEWDFVKWKLRLWRLYRLWWRLVRYVLSVLYVMRWTLIGAVSIPREA